MKIGFVVLCYGKFNMVDKCLNYIFNINNVHDLEIVLVDNCSPDNTGLKIKEKYKNRPNMHVILNDNNSGFAKGNNLGYKYAVEKLKCDNIVVMNSDVFIKDRKFVNKLEDVINSNNSVSIMAPDVIDTKGIHINPFRTKRVSIKDAKRSILINSISSFLFFLHINYYYFKKTKKKKNVDYKSKQYNIMPHGSCIIYTKEWIKKEDKAFYNKTFLFCEEYFLFEYAINNHHRILYDPSLKVIHVGDASIDNNYKNIRKKILFVNKNQNDSLRKYCSFLKNINKSWVEL